MCGWMDGWMDGSSNGKEQPQAAIHPSEKIILVAWLAQDTILFNFALHVRVLLSWNILCTIYGKTNASKEEEVWNDAAGSNRCLPWRNLC